ncbi:MAG: glycosyltransferase [Candidatus Zixiibacteriota bacterium]
MKMQKQSAKLVVGVPVRNQLNFVRACLATLAKWRLPETEIIIVDDASNTPCRDFLEDFADREEGVALLKNDRQRGFPYNCNEIIYNSASETICLLNSDTLVTPNWDKYVLEVMALDDKNGLAGPSTSFTHTPQSLAGLRQIRMNHDEQTVVDIAASVYKQYRDKYEPMSQLGGFCLFFKRKVIKDIGYFDERFGLGGGEEDDFVFRARKAGYSAIWVKYAYVHHYGHCSFTEELGSASSDLWVKNNMIYKMKRLMPGMGEIRHLPKKREKHASPVY